MLHTRYLGKRVALFFTAAAVILALPQAFAETGITNFINGTTVGSSSGYIVGDSGAYNALVITNRGVLNVTAGDSVIGQNRAAIGNVVFVTGPGSVWSNSNQLIVGNFGSGNSLTIANGAQVTSANSYLSYNFFTVSNAVMVTGSGSVWRNDNLSVGSLGWGGDRLTIADGGQVFSGAGNIGSNFATNNAALVTGAGSAWNIAGNLALAGGSSLSVLNGGTVAVTNAAGTGQINVGWGTLSIGSDGLVVADRFFAIGGSASKIDLNGGILSVNSIQVINNAPFIIGDGVSSAALMLNSYPTGWRVGTPALRGAGPGDLCSFANDLVVRNNGVLALFTKANVGGNYIQNSGSALMVGFGGTAPGQYGYLNITGTANLAGRMEAYGYGGFTPTNGMQITFLHAGSGYSGSFSGFSNMTAMAASIVYPNGNDVAVQWSQTPFGSYALTPGQSAVGGALDRDTSNPRMAALVNLLNSLPTSSLPAAMDSLSPQQLTAMSLAGVGTANVQAGNVQSRFNALLGGVGSGLSGGFSLFDPTGMMDWVNQQPRFASMLPAELELAMSREALTSGILRRSAENPWGVFVEGAGQFVGVDSVPNASGYHVTTAGMTVGIDRQVLDAAAWPHDQIVVGVALGYANSSTYLTGDGRVDINGVQGTVYGVWFKEGWHVEASGGGGANLYDTRRQVLGQTASGNTEGRSLQGMLGGGYDWKKDRWTFGPRATAQYTTVDIDGFTESGSLAPLTLGSQRMDSLLTQVGMHVAHTSEVGKTLWTPELRLGWQHESMDSVSAVDAQFANGSGNIFSSQSVPLGRDAMVVGAGLAVQWSKALTTYVNYSTELMRNNYSVHNVNAGVRFSF
jgi:outer membrane autotransporter protein